VAITWICGFEAGSLLAEPPSFNNPITASNQPYTVGSVSRETTIVRSGTGSLKLTPASGAAGQMTFDNTQRSATQFKRAYFRVTALPATARGLWGNTGTYIGLRLNPAGTLAVVGAGSTLFTSSAALTDTNKWYKVTLKSGAAGVELWIDDASQGTNASTLEFLNQLGADDAVAATYTAYVDDLAIDDATQPGNGKVLLAVPVSVNQAGSWTGGAGGAVAIAAVDFPPAGTATETDSTQIESVDASGDNSTDECRINLTTYTNLGVGASDTINTVMPFVWQGEDINTGTKAGSMGLQANPADTYGTFNYGNDDGALGTFNVQWRCTFRATNSPSVTLGNNPVIAVRKTDAGTRVASVCAMGMYVDYTPAVAALFKQKVVGVNQAVSRASVY
jgi:hypothetical protein